MAEYVFEVKMTCGGCKKAVERALGKVEGLDSVSVDLGSQLVNVTSQTVDYDTVLEKITKTGKKVISGKTI